jgi:hypothetical protein
MRRTYSYDNDLLLKDTGAITATAAAQVGGAAKVHDCGANTRIDAMLVIDVSAIEIDSANEEYDIIVQGSTASAFTAGTIQNLAQMNLGSTSVRQGAPIDTTVGRYELPFTNFQDDVAYRYIRVYIVIAGTIVTGINFTAYMAPIQGR